MHNFPVQWQKKFCFASKPLFVGPFIHLDVLLKSWQFSNWRSIQKKKKKNVEMNERTNKKANITGCLLHSFAEKTFKK